MKGTTMKKKTKLAPKKAAAPAKKAAPKKAAPKKTAPKPKPKPAPKPVEKKPEPAPEPIPQPVQDLRQGASAAVVSAAREAFKDGNTVFSVMGGIYEMDREVGDKLKAALKDLEDRA